MTRAEAIRFLGDSVAKAAILEDVDAVTSGRNYLSAMEALGVPHAEVVAVAEAAYRELQEEISK